MEKITKNTLVSISLRTEDQRGTLLEDNEEIMYLHGNYGQVFQKLENFLEGKKVGDDFSMLLTPKEAFGEYDNSLVVKESLEDLPEDVALGMELENEENAVILVVEDIKDGYAVLNGNHELAGIPLKVSGEVLETEQLSDKAAEEILTMEHNHEH